MAYSAADLSANEIAWAADDKHMLSSNALYASGITGGWDKAATTGTVASATDDATGFEAYRLFDGLPGDVSKPDGSGTTISIVLDCSAAPIEFDWWGVLNHNLKTLACTALVLQIADDNAFTTNLITLSTTNINTAYTTDRRFADLVLETGGGTARRYSAVPYVRIQITCSSGVPQIGQIILGRRRQMQFAPDRPWDPTNQSSAADDFESRSGTIYRVARRKGRREISALFHHNTAAEQNDILDWWADIEAAEQPFFYTDEPDTNPDDFWMMVKDPELRYPFTLHSLRDVTIDAVEQGPSGVYKAQESTT